MWSGKIEFEGIGAAHGVGEFAMNSATFTATVGWGLSVPFRAPFWMSGRSSFSQSWQSLQQSNAAFREFGEHWMHRALPGDLNSTYYHTARGGVCGGLELGTLAVGGYSIAKGAYNITQRTFSLSRTLLTQQKISPPPTTACHQSDD